VKWRGKDSGAGANSMGPNEATVAVSHTSNTSAKPRANRRFIPLNPRMEESGRFPAGDRENKKGGKES